MRALKPTIYVLIAMLGTSIALGAQGQVQKKMVCDMMLARAKADNGSTKLKRYREFLAKCPRHPGVNSAQARITASQPRLAKPKKPSRSAKTVRKQSRSGVPPARAERSWETTSVAEALARATRGETLYINPGYHQLGTAKNIGNSVRLIGRRSPQGELPRLTGRFVITGGDVLIENLILESDEFAPVITVRGGSVTIVNSQILHPSSSNVAKSPNAGSSALYLQHGSLQVTGGSIGPGYSQAVAVASGNLAIDGTLLTNRKGSVLYIFGGIVSIEGATISGDTGLIVTGSPHIEFARNAFLTARGAYAVRLKDRPSGKLLFNSFANSSESEWLCAERSVVKIEKAGNIEGNGRIFRNHRWASSC